METNEQAEHEVTPTAAPASSPLHEVHAPRHWTRRLGRRNEAVLILLGVTAVFTGGFMPSVHQLAPPRSAIRQELNAARSPRPGVDVIQSRVAGERETWRPSGPVETSSPMEKTSLAASPVAHHEGVQQSPVDTEAIRKAVAARQQAARERAKRRERRLARERARREEQARAKQEQDAADRAQAAVQPDEGFAGVAGDQADDEATAEKPAPAVHAAARHARGRQRHAPVEHARPKRERTAPDEEAPEAPAEAPERDDDNSGE